MAALHRRWWRGGGGAGQHGLGDRGPRPEWHGGGGRRTSGGAESDLGHMARSGPDLLYLEFACVEELCDRSLLCCSDRRRGGRRLVLFE